MRLLFFIVTALCFAGCSKCGEAPKPVDSQKVVLAPDSGRSGAVGDLRTGLIITVPEFRGVNNLVTIAAVERRLLQDPSDGGDLVAAVEPYFAEKRWTKATDGGQLVAHNKPFFLEVAHEEGEAVLRVGLVIPGEDIVKLLQTPAPLTSQQLANLMPVANGTPAKPDVFFFEAHYIATDELGTRLIKDLLAGHVKAGWTILEAPNALLGVDGGLLENPFKTVLRDPSNGGTLTVGRVGNHTAITWEQQL